MRGLKHPSGAPNTALTQKLGRSETRSGGGGIELGSSCVQREKSKMTSFPFQCHLKANLYLAPPPGPGDSAMRNAGFYSEYLGDDFPGPSPCLSHKVLSTCI